MRDSVQPIDYSVAVWRIGSPSSVAVLQECVAAGAVDTREKAARWGLRAAIESGSLAAGDRYEVDVSEGASDEWETSLVGEVVQSVTGGIS